MKNWMKWALGCVGGAVAGGTAYMLAPIVKGAGDLAASSLVTLKPFGGTKFMITGAGPTAGTYQAKDPLGVSAPRTFAPHNILKIVAAAPGLPALGAAAAAVVTAQANMVPGADKLGAGSFVQAKDVNGIVATYQITGKANGGLNLYIAQDTGMKNLPRALSPQDIVAIVQRSPAAPLLA